MRTSYTVVYYCIALNKPKASILPSEVYFNVSLSHLDWCCVNSLLWGHLQSVPVDQWEYSTSEYTKSCFEFLKASRQYSVGYGAHTCTTTVICPYPSTHTHTDICSHTKQSLQQPLPSSLPTLGCLALLKTLEPCAPDPPGAGLVVTCRSWFNR